MKVIQSIIKRPLTICMTIILIIFLGILSITKMPVKLLPDLNIPILGITIVYPGASSDVVETDVTCKVEEAITNVSGITETKTYSIENAAIIILDFEFDTNLNEKMKEIQDALNKIDLPSNCEDPTISMVDFNASAVANIFLNPTVVNKTDEIQNLVNQLIAIDGVGNVEVKGLEEHKVVIEPIQGLEVISLLIVNELSKGQLDIPLGSIVENENTIAIRNESKVTSVKDLANIKIVMHLENDKWEHFETFNNLITKFTEMTTVEEEDFFSLCQLNQFLYNYLISHTLDEVIRLKSTILLFKTLIDSTSDENWNPQKYQELVKQSLGIEVSVNCIELFRNIDKSILEEKINCIVTFKQNHQETFTNDEYQDLLIEIGIDATVVKYNDIILKIDEEKWNAILQIKYQTIPITNDDVLKIAQILTIDDSLGLQLSADLIHFIRTMDYNKIENGNYTTRLAEYIDMGNGEYQIKPIVANINNYLENTSYSYYNGEKGVILEVYANSGSNTSNIVKNVKFILDKNSGILLDDQAQFIDDSISNVLTSILIGGILAIVIIYLFLRRIKCSFVIAITMPLSIMLALIVLNILNITLNMVSLGGMAIGIGMLVDNSIVVIESITKKLETGKHHIEEAAYFGTKEVAGSLLASTLTTICVFIPILFTKGLTKEIFTDLSWAVVLSLTFSLIVAIFIIPTLFVLFYKKRGWKVDSVDNKKRFMDKVEVKYSNFLKKALNRKCFIIICSVLIFLASGILIFTRGIEFLPPCDEGVIEVNITFPTQYNLEKANLCTNDIAKKIEDHIEDLESLSVSVGDLGLIPISKSAQLRIQLTDTAPKTAKVVDEIRKLVKEWDDVSIRVSEVDGIVASITSGFNNLTIDITGADEEKLKEISNRIKEDLLLHKGFTRITDNLTEKVKEYKIVIDQGKCLEYDINYEQTIQMLRIGLAGYEIETIVQDGIDTPVLVKFNQLSVGSLEELENFVIGLNKEQTIKIKDIAVVNEEEIKPVILKSDGLPLLTLDIETTGIDTGSASKIIDTVTRNVLKDYDGYFAKSSGVQSYLDDAFSGLFVALVVSIFLLFMVMACQFESLLKPLVIMASIPLSFTGAFLFLAMTKTTLNVVSFIGIIMLMGVIVNNAIIMLDEIKRLHMEEGENHFVAVIKGCTHRLRPILMTTLTTILALIPLSLGLGAGGKLMQPMAIVVIGGLFIGTFVTLLLIPTIYCSIKKVKQ